MSLNHATYRWLVYLFDVALEDGLVGLRDSGEVGGTLGLRDLFVHLHHFGEEAGLDLKLAKSFIIL